MSGGPVPRVQFKEMLYSTGVRQLEWLKFQQGESDLVYSGGKFYLLATCEVPEPTPEDVDGYLGVDLGITEIATDSLQTSYSGAQVKRVRRKHRRLRKSLQKCGSRSAKRKLKKLSGREARFGRNTNHVVSKAIVKTAECNRLVISVEKLTGIRSRVQVKRGQRDDLHRWSFFQLKGFLAYKARLAGVPLVEIDPRNTSRTCSKCGHCDKGNRKTQAEFVCQACGHADNADRNAARNIAAKADIKRPIVTRVESKSVQSCTSVASPPL